MASCVPRERLIVTGLVTLDVLRAAVVGEHAAEPQVRQLVHHLRQRERLIAGRNAAARADGHVDDDVGRDAGGFRRVRQIARVLRVIHGLDVLAILLPQVHRPLNLRLAEIRRRHADLLHAFGKQRSRLRPAWPCRCRRRPPRAAASQSRRTCGSSRAAGIRPSSPARLARIAAMFCSSLSRSSTRAGVSRSHFDIPRVDFMSTTWARL